MTDEQKEQMEQLKGRAKSKAVDLAFDMLILFGEHIVEFARSSVEQRNGFKIDASKTNGNDFNVHAENFYTSDIRDDRPWVEKDS